MEVDLRPFMQVGLFGSAEIGVDNATSDLDLCVIVRLIFCISTFLILTLI
jgi:predicted nucleotidyltransferase